MGLKIGIAFKGNNEKDFVSELERFIYQYLDKKDPSQTDIMINKHYADNKLSLHNGEYFIDLAPKINPKEVNPNFSTRFEDRRVIK